MDKKFKVAIVGATGVVGRCILKVLEEENLPFMNINLLHQKNQVVCL